RNPLSGPSRFPLGAFARRLLFRVLRPYTVRRQEFDQAVVAALQGMDADLRRLSGVDAALGQLTERVGTFESAVSQHLQAIDEKVARVLYELHAEPYMSDPGLLRTKDPQGREAIGFAGNDLPAGAGELYRGFENIFRGPEEFIRDRQRVYLELIGERQPVLDVGCGRGEFLDLLSEAGTEAVGIDIDEGMVMHCRAKGHD